MTFDTYAVHNRANDRSLVIITTTLVLHNDANDSLIQRQMVMERRMANSNDSTNITPEPSAMHKEIDPRTLCEEPLVAH